MSVLTVRNLCKTYPGFALKNVSFALKEGAITGFIGRNGAGKTTTLKSLLNFVHPDCGEVLFDDMPFAQHELAIKQRIGFVSGGVDYYPKKKLRTIAQVNRRFYDEWDDEAYRRYLSMFALDENKTPDALSAGMKVKFSLALALSHNARLLLLDEPTSGLDPVSRDDLLDVFLQLADTGKITILFSTHITSDLEKCAQEILYLKQGELVGSGPMEAFVKSYRVLHFEEPGEAEPWRGRLLGERRSRDGWTALVRAEDLMPDETPSRAATLEDIMVHMEKEAI